MATPSTDTYDGPNELASDLDSDTHPFGQSSEEESEADSETDSEKTASWAPHSVRVPLLPAKTT